MRRLIPIVYIWLQKAIDMLNHFFNFRYTFEALQESADYLLQRITIRPKIAVICGSGMGKKIFVGRNCLGSR